MSFFPSLPENAGPPTVYTAYPEIYRPWSEMSQTMMYGDSPLSKGEREMILAFAAGVAGCPNVQVAHSEVAYVLGINQGVVEELVADIETARVQEPVRALMRFVKKLAIEPATIRQDDVDAVLAAGWSEHALQDAIGITGRAAFMQRLIQGHGFASLTREESIAKAQNRVQKGYVNLYPSFQTGQETQEASVQ